MSLTSAGGRAPGPATASAPLALSSVDASLDGAAHRPAPTTGIELLGALTGSGYRTPPSLVRRPDGQTVQLTPLLYLVLEAIDGERTYTDVAETVSTAYGRRIAPDDVRHLTEAQLRPLGLVRGPDGSEPELKKANPLLALRFRWIVSDPEVTRRITAPFAALFTPLVVVIVVLAFALISGWVLFTKGLGSATHQAFDQPILLVVVFAITIFSAGFHEFGHASACRYGGATPGAMGTGLYLVWPAFYTDVTDSYRLGRAGRLRVDLGGLYFNALVTVAMFVVWLVTGWDALLLILAAQLLQMVRQLAPMVRFDGYHVLADLTGVPDLASRIGPTLRGLVPGREPEARAAELKRWARVVVTAWVLVIVPLLLVTLVLMVAGAASRGRHRVEQRAQAGARPHPRLGRRRPRRRGDQGAVDRGRVPARARLAVRARPPRQDRDDLALDEDRRAPRAPRARRARRRRRGGSADVGVVARRQPLPPGPVLREGHPRRGTVPGELRRRICPAQGRPDPRGPALGVGLHHGTSDQGPPPARPGAGPDVDLVGRRRRSATGMGLPVQPPRRAGCG